MTPRTAEVAVPVPLRTPLHYAVPADLDARAAPGTRVLVPLGRRRVVGYVVARDTPPPAHVKLVTISAVLDDELPTFAPALLEFLAWMTRYYRAPPGEVFRSAHPAGTNVRGVPALRLTASGRDARPAGVVGAALAALRAHEGPLQVQALEPAPSASQVARMVREGWVERLEVVEPPRVEVRTEDAWRAVGPAPTEHRGPGGKPLKRDVIHAWLVGRGAVPASALREAFPHVRPHLQALVDEGAVVRESVEVLRDPFFGAAVPRDARPTLTAGQRAAVDAIVEGEGYRAFLLHGETGSGKTEVYLHAIEAMLARGRGALVLVPEIALTPQLVRRFRARLGDALAVVHSGLADGARFDQWRRLRRGEVKVAIGARSGVFAPVADLGLIIVDEEHDPSFKQGDGVRYHGRDMALVRGHLEGARVVLGSATPSLESTRNVEQGKLTRLNLRGRPTGGALPPVELVDLRLTARAPDDHWFLSPPLRDALAQTLARGEQAILFLNRRGFSSFVQCSTCGHALECDQCAVSLTFHRARRQLRCHYCDAARPLPPTCPACTRKTLELLGRGTERVEEALTTLFPAARVARLDRDTASGRKLEDLLGAMRDRRIDVLVGTQMVTKGHDFPDVTLVGVLDADASLNFPDFRAGERTFQLLTQVAGRAGRGRRAGRVLVQTHEPAPPCRLAIRDHDHAAFSAFELANRRLTGFPPFTHAAALRVDGRDAGRVEALARRVGVLLQQAGAGQDGTRLRGPAPAPLGLLRGRTRWALLLTADRRDALHRLLGALEAADPQVPDTRLVVDIDPYDFL